MNLGVQYYRPPFPDPKCWADDFAQIRDSGLDTVQLWALWAWVEPDPGRFRFDDYDRLIELADKNSLGVILSTIAEIQPYWIHSEVPGSEMIDHMGRKVVSSNREECHFGLTPGGCTDHPGVWDRMERFLGEVVTRYRSAGCLRGWDAWNELRWNLNSDGLVCFCEHTLKAFRNWLDERFGGLEGLNHAWKRRYGRWEEVLPGKLPRRSFTETMAFQHFITVRANRHGKARYNLMKSLDGEHPITVHAGNPCPLMAGDRKDHAINRGNDWFYADDMDGVGCSSFPRGGVTMDDAAFAVRIEFARSAARDKHLWLSELQGGRATYGLDRFEVEHVDAPSQQRWLWNGIACGAEAIIFWCWRDEVFGMESAGYGLAGLDGYAAERLDAMKVTGRLIEQHRQLIDNYKPTPPTVGVFFSPQAYYLGWARDGNAALARDALIGYCRSLIRNSIPYTVVEEEHLDVLADLKVLFLPRTVVLDRQTENVLSQWVQDGGTLVCESECGAFNSHGLYRYPTDRFPFRLAGIHEVGRRRLQARTITANLGGQTVQLPVSQWLTPLQGGKGNILAQNDEGLLINQTSVGKGNLLLAGTYLGDAYLTSPGADFERFVRYVVTGAGWTRDFEVLSPEPTDDSFVYVKTGHSGQKKVVFVFLPQNVERVHLRFRAGFFATANVKDVISGKTITLRQTTSWQECAVDANEWRISLLVESPANA